MGHKKRKQAAKTSSRLERYKRARRQNDARLQQQEESAIFFQQMEIVCAEMITETASEIVEDIAQEIIENLEIREAVVDSVVNRIITEEVSVVENVL